MRKQKGFTIIEIIVAISLIALISIITIVSLKKQDKADEKEIVKIINNVASVYLEKTENKVLSNSIGTTFDKACIPVSDLINSGLLAEEKTKGFKDYVIVEKDENNVLLFRNEDDCSRTPINGMEIRCLSDQLPPIEYTIFEMLDKINNKISSYESISEISPADLNTFIADVYKNYPLEHCSVYENGTVKSEGIELIVDSKETSKNIDKQEYTYESTISIKDTDGVEPKKVSYIVRDTEVPRLIFLSKDDSKYNFKIVPATYYISEEYINEFNKYDPNKYYSNFIRYNCKEDEEKIYIFDNYDGFHPTKTEEPIFYTLYDNEDFRNKFYEYTFKHYGRESFFLDGILYYSLEDKIFNKNSFISYIEALHGCHTATIDYYTPFSDVYFSYIMEFFTFYDKDDDVNYFNISLYNQNSGIAYYITSDYDKYSFNKDYYYFDGYNTSCRYTSDSMEYYQDFSCDTIIPEGDYMLYVEYEENGFNMYRDIPVKIENSNSAPTCEYQYGRDMVNDYLYDEFDYEEKESIISSIKCSDPDGDEININVDFTYIDTYHYVDKNAESLRYSDFSVDDYSVNYYACDEHDACSENYSFGISYFKYKYPREEDKVCYCPYGEIVSPDEMCFYGQDYIFVPHTEVDGCTCGGSYELVDRYVDPVCGW